MRFEILGALSVSGAQGTIDVSRPAQRRVLGLLLISPGETVSSSQLVDRLWGSSPPTNAKDTLHVHLVGLRKALGRSVIESHPTGYRIAVEGNSMDVNEFSDGFVDCLSAVRREAWKQGLELATRTLGLWRGTPYPDLADNDHAQPAIAGLEEQHLQLQELRIRTLLALGRNEETMPLLEELAFSNPLRERLWQYLMLARYRVGRQAESLDAYQQIRRSLGEELGIEPSFALRQLEEQILLHDPVLGVDAEYRSPSNLPETHTSFVGREKDTEAIEDLLTQHRVVLLSGGPGIGKTRLAVEVGRRMLDVHPAGTWFVQLGEDSSLREIAASVSTALGLTESIEHIPRLVEGVSQWRGLLIIDGVEHVPEAAHALVASLNATAGRLRVLLTTRSREREAGPSYRVTAMSAVPKGVGVEAAVASDAVRLFIDRARANDRSFSVTESNVDQVIEMCNGLGGVPLAIELAANWGGSLDVSNIADILGERTSGASVDSALELSYQLLQSDTREIFRTMSIFPGSFSLSDLRSVCSPGEGAYGVASGVVRLVGASLVETQRTDDGGLRYRLLEPVRGYARRQIADDVEAERIIDRHADHFEALCRELAKGIGTEGEREVFRQLDRHLPDLRMAWDRLLHRGEHGRVVMSVAGIDRYFFVRFLAGEGRSLLRRAVTDVVDDQTLAVGLCSLGLLSYIEDDFQSAVGDLEAAARIADSTGDGLTEAWALAQLARVRTAIGDFSDASEAGARASDLFRQLGDARGKATADFWFGVNEVNETRGSSTSHLQAAVDALDAVGDLRLVSVGHRILSDAALGSGQEQEARDRASRAKEAAEICGDTFAIIGSLVQISLVEAKWGDLKVSARSLLEADTLLTGPSELDRMAVVGWSAVPALIRAGRRDLARLALETSDRVHARYGSSVPPAFAVVLEESRADLAEEVSTSTSDQRTTDELVDDVRIALQEMAGAHDAMARRLG